MYYGTPRQNQDDLAIALGAHLARPKGAGVLGRLVQRVRLLRGLTRQKLAITIAGIVLIGSLASSHLATAQGGGGLDVGGGDVAFGGNTTKPVGFVFTDGFTAVWNKGDQPIKIVRVSGEMTGNTLRFKGAYVAGLDRTFGLWQILPSFPPREPKLGVIRPAVGAILPPGPEAAHLGFQLLLGYEVVGEGRSTRRSVTVDYEVAGRRHRETLTSTLAVCSPMTYKGQCPAEYADGKS